LERFSNLTRNKAVFLDRDGVLNELVYSKSEGRVGSPFAASELRLIPKVAEAIKRIQQMGFKTIIISNQPGVAKKQFTYDEFEKMKTKVRKSLAKDGCILDGEYYCLHSTTALIKKYKLDCNCKKPKPGLLIQAATENEINLSKSYFVGDGLVDVKAGAAVGCKTILISHMTNFLNEIMSKQNTFPDYLVDSLNDVPKLLASQNKIA
jgi:D-glycero-D-manno-heptose 1,7-bisphosphate phosphatase